ncbi:MAG: type II toxin-antitoxin system VapB family antitoxin [Acetobacteraceae bacterium]
MTTTTLFLTNHTQAVRLPKSAAFPKGVREVEILKIGNSRMIVPKGRRWDDYFLQGPGASADFMRERGQPPAEEREPL